MPPALIGIGGGALLGGIAGAIPKTSSQDSTSTVTPGRESDLSGKANGVLGNTFDDLNSMVNSGPGQQDVTNATGASRDYAAMLDAYSKQGGNLPSAGDISSANDIAQNIFAPQRTQMSQAFQDQSIQANRQAALMGRDMNDPVLRAKLAQEQTRQSAMLGANQGAFSQQFAIQQPMQRLGFAEQHAQVLGGLASQAMANRQALAAMGQGIMSNDQNFRLNTATRNGNVQQSSGGGLGGAVTGLLGGAGAGMSMGAGLGGLGGGASSPLSLGTSGANSFFNQSSMPMGQQMGQLPSFSPFTGAASAPQLGSSYNAGGSRNFGFGY